MNKFIEQVLYDLKKDSHQVDLYRRISAAVNASTGDLVVVEQKVKIYQAITMPLEIARKFSYDLSYIAANKNFIYGAYFDTTATLIIIDILDLPVDYVLNLNDRFVFQGRRWEIKSATEFQVARAYSYIVEEVKNQKVNEIIDTVEEIEYTETLVGIV